MSGLRTHWLPLVVLASLLSSCEQEPITVDATQVVFTINSDIESELASVEATVYDVRGEKRGDHSSFDLSTHPLPFSFTVVPTLETTTDFMLVVSGKDAGGTEVVETKVTTHFVSRKTLRVQLWLSRLCLGQTCSAQETCSASNATAAACGAIPTLAGDPITPGEEFDGATTFETDPVMGPDASTAADTGVPATELDATANPSDSAPNALAMDAGPDAPPYSSASGACLGSPSQAVCSDATLSVCNSLGQVEKQETCQSARQCQLGIVGKSCAPCNPGARRCTGVRLERCAEDGLSWELLKSCASEALCNAVAGDCVAGACTATTRACMGNDLYGCSQDLTELTRLKACLANMCDQTNGECDVCIPNSHTCSGSFAESCDSRGQTLTRTECTGTTPKCTGAGQCVQCTAPTDCPTPTSQCQTATCTASTARCGSTPKAAHVGCTGGVCNGSGTCVECVDETDCKTTGARKCSNARCVACTSNTDCPATYECGTNQTCQKVSIAGTGTACLSVATATSGMCGGYFCGVSSTRFSAAFDPAGTCGPNTSFMCQGALWPITSKCATDHALDPDVAASAKTCIKGNAAIPSSGLRDACIDCFIQAETCCQSNSNCLQTCLISAGTKACEDAKKAAGCLSPFFTCTGLPSPL